MLLKNVHTNRQINKICYTDVKISITIIITQNNSLQLSRAVILIEIYLKIPPLSTNLTKLVKLFPFSQNG